MARLITPDGRGDRWMFPLDGRSFQLEELYAAIGASTIEWHNAIPDLDVLVMDQDGKRKKLPPNPIATSMLTGLIQRNDMVRGSVLLCSRQEAGYNDDVGEGEDP